MSPRARCALYALYASVFALLLLLASSASAQARCPAGAVIDQRDSLHATLELRDGRHAVIALRAVPWSSHALPPEGATLTLHNQRCGWVFDRALHARVQARLRWLTGPTRPPEYQPERP
ncbi:MAG: hypothetical protein Q8Q09_02675 [Deltaproteobacteria bacterium]|nr:hypothetical protein [Deltaproteobacteria bacterium]